MLQAVAEDNVSRDHMSTTGKSRDAYPSFREREYKPRWQYDKDSGSKAEPGRRCIHYHTHYHTHYGDRNGHEKRCTETIWHEPSRKSNNSRDPKGCEGEAPNELFTIGITTSDPKFMGKVKRKLFSAIESHSNNKRPSGTASSSRARTARIVEVAELDGLQVDDTKEERKVDQKEDHNPGDKHMQKEKIRFKVADLHADLRRSSVQPDYRGVLNSVTMSLIMDIFVLSAAQAQGLYTQVMDSRHSRTDLFRLALNCVLKMVEHCLDVFRNLLNAYSIYNTTGDWPKPSEKDISRFATDLCQAMVYLVALGFVMMLVGRAVGYVVLIEGFYWAYLIDEMASNA
ncbi:hypothetical protein BBP40_004382 [Aspergillus hancockii]|nr:hypothetical protein BBP40_004382 [Aspergillus hancockii]